MGNDRDNTDDLPGFLNDATPGHSEATAEPTVFADDDVEVDEAVESVDADDDATAEAADQDDDLAATAPRIVTATPAPGGGAGIALGVLLLLGGLGLGFGYANGMISTGLQAYGLAPQTLLLLGGITVAAGLLRRSQVATARRLDLALAEQDERARQMSENLDYLVDHHGSTDLDKPPAQGEELQRMLLHLQRQDEKVTNLTKAIKMYGKPLMEISNLSADIGAMVTQLKTHLEGLLEQNRQGFTRVELALQAGDGDQQLLEGLQQQFGKTEARLQQQINQLGDKLPRGDQLQLQLQQLTEKLPRSDQLQQQLTRVEASIQAQAQRLDDSELRKSMLRIEDAHKQLHGSLERLVAGGSAKDASQQLGQQFDSALGKLAHGLDELKNGNIGALETAVRDIQRELAGVATTVANIQQGIKNAPRQSTSAPAPGAAPVAAAPVAAASTGGSASPAAAASSGDGNATGYQTGTRKAPAKNVLGAIARLKQMKQ